MIKDHNEIVIIYNLKEKKFLEKGVKAFIYNRRLYCDTNSAGYFQDVLK